MKATVYRSELTHYDGGDYLICGFCNEMFIDDNVSGLYAVWLYCPFCGMKFGHAD